MATKDRKKLQHIHSSIADKQPTPQSLEVGEIAVNNSAGKEFLSLKNSNDKVVRFSSDSTLIDWIENKEVVPYKGYVRGETGPSATSGDTPTPDGYGSYGITNDDLLNNKSNIIVKINQVAAKKTVKYDRINAAKDLYNKEVNPSENTPTGKTDGAGFFIDMSRYAMIGANPTFSSITVTDKSDLSGNTTIANGDGTGTRIGHTLAIKTTDVTANDTNWTETITNRTSTVTNETDKITTLNESATTRTTVVGTENLTVSGSTTETKVGNVVENHSGTTTETKAGNVAETNLADKQESTSGNSYNDVNLAYSGTTGGTTTEVKVGNVTENHSGTTTENYSGKWTVNVTSGTEITSCSSTTINTNEFKLTQCDGTSGTAEFDFCGGYKINTDKMEILQCSENGTMDVKEKAITVSGTSLGLSGTSLTIRENGATDFSGNTLTATTASNANINVKGNLTEVVTGTTNETHTGAVTITNSNNKTENTIGAHSIYSTGNTCVNSQANANFYGKVNTNIGIACDGTTKGSATTVVGTTTLNMSGSTTTISGNTTNVTGATTLNLSGNTINERALTANTNVTSAYTSATTATTVIGIANTSATTATLSGNTLDITEATRLSAKTPSTYVSGTTLDIKENNTDITSCGRISANTNDFEVKQCAANGKAIINSDDIDISGKTFDVVETTSATIKAPATTISGTSLTLDEGTSISAKTPSTTISGANFTLNETNTTINSCGKVEITTDKYTLKQCSTSGGTAEFEFCNVYTVKSNAINIQQCGTAGTVNITSQTQNVNGGSLTIRESGATDFSGNTLTTTTASDANINVKGNLTEVVTGITNETHTGAVTINNGAAKTETTTGAVTENNKAGYTVNTTGDTCLQSTADVNVGGAANTNIGTNCDDTVKANYVNIKAKSGITETANTVTISGTTSANISGATVNVSGGTINETSSGKTCITAGSDLNIGGDANTNIGYNCAGTGIANNTNIFASTAVTINAPTTNITGNTYLSGNTYFHKTCTGLTNNEIDAAFCEVLSRGAITIEKNTSPTDPQLATVYTVKQNGAVINTIEVAKDQFLQNAEVVKNTSGEWVIRLTWWIYDPDSGTHTTATTDVNASELVKDLTAVNPSDNGTALNHNVSVNAWYDSTSGDMKFSAETTPNMHVGNMYVTGTTSASTVSGTNVNGGTISGTTVKGVTISGTNITASSAIKANNVSANTISAASSINTSDLYASSTVSGATVSGTTVKGAAVSAGTLTATGNTTLAAASASSISATSISSPTISGTNITASAAIRANNVSASTISATTFTGAMSKKLTWAAGAFTADTTGYNGSADKTITVPTAISHLPTRGKLTITHNGLSDTYDPASDKSMTLPHSALTINFGVATGQTNTSYNTSAGKTITIPTATSHLSKAALTIDYNADVRSKSDTSYDTTAAATVSIPGSLDHLSNYDGTNINIGHPTKINGNVTVTGTVTASGAIYSSDRNLKENIFDIDSNELEKAGLVSYKTYNFKGEDNKMYGIIAQDLQEAGLGELVYSREDGTLAVDYTSFMILELARLRRDNETLLNRMAWLERRIEKLESEKKD